MTRLISVYLNDHLSGATAALELVRRASREHEGSELGRFLTGLAVQLAEDRQALKRVMGAAGVRQDPAKVAVAWLGEKLGRLKFNGHLVRRSPLTPFIELEVVEAGIHGKLLGWLALREQRPPGADAVDLDALIERARRQLEEVERRRLEASQALRAS